MHSPSIVRIYVSPVQTTSIHFLPSSLNIVKSGQSLQVPSSINFYRGVHLSGAQD